MLPAVGAERLPVEGVLLAHGPTTLIGQTSLALESPGILMAGPAAADRFELTAPGGTARLVNVPTMRVLTPNGPAKEETLAEELVAHRPADKVAFDGHGDAAPTVARILPSLGALELRLAGAHETSWLPAGPANDRNPAFGDSATLAGHPVRPGAGGFGIVDLGGISWEQPFHALAMGGTAAFPDGQTWTTGRWLNATRSTVDPVTGTGLAVYDNVALVFESRAGTIAWPAGNAGWGLLASSLSGSVAGDAVWTAVDAQLQAGGKPLPADPRLVQVKGDLRVDARFGEPPRWTLHGDAEFVGVDGRPAWVGTAAEVGAFAALAAALAWLGRGGLAVLAGRLVPRLAKADPLRSPSRRVVLEAIHGRQPVDVAGLRAATGLSRTSLDYHLRVLLSYEVIQTRPGAGGRRTTYMLNSGSLAFRVFGSRPDGAWDEGPGPLAAQALAVANSHPLRRSLYEAIRDHGPIDFAGLARLRDQAGAPRLAQSSATHHLQALVRAGAVEQAAEGRRRVYRAALDDRDARVEQYRRFLGQERGLDLVRQLVAGPLDRARLAQGRRADAQRLDRLVALGIVRFDPAGSRYELPPFIAPWAHLL
jgi:DNA-binding transcriptional ArsR family regulator